MRGGSLSSLAQANSLKHSAKAAKPHKRAKLSNDDRERSSAPEASSAAQVASVPKARKERLAADALKWRTLNPASFSGFDDGGGMMMLEELDDVAVEWETAEGGMKVARFVVSLLNLEVVHADK
jgi:ATP-dependent RNA helicase DDX24/MAK5